MLREQWRPVVGYELHYEVSDRGRVRRVAGGRGATAGRILKLKAPTSTCDYIRVQLCRGDIKRTCGVHVLVAEAFHGRRPRGKFPNHKDLNKVNNSATNLEWLTKRQNDSHARLHGKKGGAAMPGALNPRAKLTQLQVDEIRRQRGRVGQRALSRLCGVSKSAIQFIHQGKHWRNA
jgi:hypothetical protein